MKKLAGNVAGRGLGCFKGKEEGGVKKNEMGIYSLDTRAGRKTRKE